MSRHQGCPVFLLCIVLLAPLFGSCSRPMHQTTRMSTAISTDPRFGTSIYGKVVDDKGAPLPGVSLVLESGNHASLTVQSSMGGNFAFRNLPVGTYSVNASIEGFTEVRHEGVQVAAGTQIQLEFTLKPSLSEEFTVIGETPMVDTKRSGGNTVTYGRGQGHGMSDPGMGGSMGSGNIIPESNGSRHGRRKQAQQPAYSGPSEELIVIATDDEWSQPATSGGDREAGTLIIRKDGGKPAAAFPLKHTEVTAQVSGFLARTTLEQEFLNPYTEPVEAEYVFPLPSMSAVNEFVMDTGSNRILGVVRPRAEAEEIYRAARESGMTASLLTQERPNIFDQKIANIEPSGTVKITLTYFERLAYDDGFYEYVVPTVVGERYGSGFTAEGCADQRAATESRMAMAPVIPVKWDGRSEHDIGITVRLNAGLPIRQLDSPTHAIDVSVEGESERTVTLSNTTAVPNRDFVLRWSVAGKETQVGVLSHKQDADGFFALMVQPPLQPADSQVNPREITFIMDVSGSMSGLPVETSRDLVRKTLDRIRPQDLFNIVYFSGGNNQLWEGPQPPTAANLEEAKHFLGSLSAGGGTEMMAGLNRALNAHHDPRYLQMYVFLTDGYVTEDRSILQAIQEQKSGARFFAFGIGSSVNRYLIDGIGEMGGGYSVTILPHKKAQIKEAMNRFFAAIDSPVLVDPSIDWNGLPVKNVYPRKLHDLFAGQTLSLVGKYEAAVAGSIFLQGRVGDVPVRYEVPLALPDSQTENGSLACLWARQRIHELTNTLPAAEPEKKQELIEKITSLAVKYRLVSDYTSFVAVDESRIVGNGKPLKILQPLELPQGVYSASEASVPSWGLSLKRTSEGKVIVDSVQENGVAARSGVKPGAVLRAVNHASIRTLDQLEEVLLQSGKDSVELDFQQQGEVLLPLP